MRRADGQPSGHQGGGEVDWEELGQGSGRGDGVDSDFVEGEGGAEGADEAD
jgi:hypothetical protein